MKNILKIYIQNWNYILFNSKKCKFFGPLGISDRLLFEERESYQSLNFSWNVLSIQYYMLCSHSSTYNSYQ